MTVWKDEEPTRGGLNRPALRAVSDPPDPLVDLGQIMRGVARLQTDVAALRPLPAEVRVIRQELELLRDDLKEDRAELVHGASKRAANHSSNRMAALMGALFTLYEVTSPYVRDLVHWWLNK